MKAVRATLDWRWVGCSVLLLAAMASWTLLSRSFVYGEGHAERPILSFLLVYGVAWIAFAVAARRLALGDRPGPWPIVVVAVAARVLLLPSSLIQENDVYRYVLDGQVLLHGENPYALAPLEVAGRREFIPSAGLDSPEAELVFSRIGFPEIPTVYPPVAEASFALAAAISGWDWRGDRWVFMGCDLVVLCLMTALLRAAGRPLEWVLLYAWNPLILKEISNSCHVDVLVAVFILAALGVMYRYLRDPSLRTALLTGFLIGLGILSKLYPLILLPALCAVMVRRGKWGHAAAGAVGCGSVVALGYMPFLGIGWENLTRGLRTFAHVWRMNEGVFALLATVLPEPRLMAGLIIGLAAILVPWWRRDRNPDRFVRDSFWVLLVWFLVIPTPFPWYAVPLLAVGALTEGTATLVLLLSGSLALYYLGFLYEYQRLPAVWWSVTRAVEHLVIWAGVAWTVFGPSRVPRLRPSTVERAGSEEGPGFHSRL